MEGEQERHPTSTSVLPTHAHTPSCAHPSARTHTDLLTHIPTVFLLILDCRQHAIDKSFLLVMNQMFTMLAIEWGSGCLTHGFSSFLLCDPFKAPLLPLLSMGDSIWQALGIVKVGTSCSPVWSCCWVGVTTVVLRASLPALTFLLGGMFPTLRLWISKFRDWGEECSWVERVGIFPLRVMGAGEMARC